MDQNNNGTIVLAILIILILGFGIYFWQGNKEETEEINTTEVLETTDDIEIEEEGPLSYSLDELPTSVSKETVAFSYTSEDLSSMAQECGNTQTETYFTNLISKFNGAKETVYNFTYTEESQKPDTFTVTLIPNRADYTSLEEFNNDFGVCSAGGNAYPAIVDRDWLVFVSSCGSGFDDGSGLPNGCQEIRDIVEPSLELN